MQDIKQQEIFEIAQIARERVKNEAFHKDKDTGKNSLDLTHTREIIIEAISLAVEQEKERIMKAVNSRYEKWWEEAGNCNKKDIDDLMFDISNSINNK